MAHFFDSNSREHKPVVNAVLVIDMEQLVFDPGNLLRSLPASLSLQRVLSVDGCQAHHGFLTYPPLVEKKNNNKKKQTNSVVRNSVNTW